MRLFRSIFNCSLSLGERRCHHDIDCSAYRYLIQINVSSNQPFSLCRHSSVTNFDMRSQCAKPLNVQVHRTASDITASRKGHLRTLIFPKQRTQQVIGCPDFLHGVIIHRDIFHERTIDFHGMRVYTFNPRTNIRHCLKQRIDIAHIR